MYRVSKWDESEIKEFEIIKITDKCLFHEQIWPGGKRIQRELFDTSYYRWFKTKSEAIDFSIGRLNNKRDLAKIEASNCTKKIERLTAMR